MLFNFIRRLINVIGRFILRWLRLFIYVTIFVYGFGGLGIWIQLIHYNHNATDITEKTIFSTIATFIMAITAKTFADYLIMNKTDDGKTRDLILLSFLLISWVAGLGILLLPYTDTQRIFVWVGSILTFLLWLLVNSRNQNLVESKTINILGGKL